MYGMTLYITPEDVLERLSEADRARFNRCIFYDTHKNLDGSIDIDCVLFNDTDEPERKHCGSYNRTKLL